VAATELVIRRAEPAELDVLGALWFRSARAAHDYLPALQALTEPEAVRIFRGFAADLELWVATRDGVIVGLLGLEDDCIDRLYVAPSVQGVGVGTLLLEHAKALRPGGLHLFTHQKHAAARTFYERRGFRPTRFGISPAPESEPDVTYVWTGR
jgi:GNAT superfamily N-acetyltransferase